MGKTYMIGEDPEAEEKINAIQDLILGGAKERQICQYMLMTYRAKKPETLVLITAANNIIRAALEPERENRIKDAVAKLDHLYARNFARGEYSECRAITMDRARLAGDLMPDDKDQAKTVHITIGGKPALIEGEDVPS